MKNQDLFSSKDESKKLKCRLLQFFLVVYGLRQMNILSGKATTILPPFSAGGNS